MTVVVYGCNSFYNVLIFPWNFLPKVSSSRKSLYSYNGSLFSFNNLWIHVFTNVFHASAKTYNVRAQVNVQHVGSADGLWSAGQD